MVEMRERPHSKLQAPWGGPYQVINHARDDTQGPIFTCQHLANKKITEFHVSMLKKCDMGQFESPEDAVPYAAMDSWEWEVEKVTAHFPAGPRKAKGKRMRAKREYEFEVWWKHCPPGGTIRRSRAGSRMPASERVSLTSTTWRGPKFERS